MSCSKYSPRLPPPWPQYPQKYDPMYPESKANSYHLSRKEFHIHSCPMIMHTPVYSRNSHQQAKVACRHCFFATRRPSKKREPACSRLALRYYCNNQSAIEIGLSKIFIPLSYDLIQTLNVFICVTQNIFPLIFRKITCGMLESLKKSAEFL